MIHSKILSRSVVVTTSLLCLNLGPEAGADQRVYEIVDNQPAPNRGADYGIIKSRGYPFDADWEARSYPIGNGYMGANSFGRTDTERIQLTEKTLANEGLYGIGGLTSFAEIYLDLNHHTPEHYRRSLNLNEATLHVSYDQDGVHYTREYFANYPANVIVVRLSASQPGALSFTLRAEIPHLRSANEINTRTGTVVAEDDLIRLSGNIAHFSVNYEAQVKVIPDGGKTIAQNDNGGGRLRIEKANSVVLLITAGTNYELSEEVFLEDTPSLKLDGESFPHQEVTRVMERASQMGFEALKQSHLDDYQELFSRVELVLSPQVPDGTTEALLEDYQADGSNPFLEELMFHYGRYLLISSSRKGTLPCGLQGIWSQYLVTPWTGGYWHNINVQMNYWGAFSANMAETFIPYLEFFEAYRTKCAQLATDYIRETNPQNLAEDESGNGWTIGTGSTAYSVGGPGGHSGPGTGGFTTKLLWDYYDFTRDESYLREIAYPALLGMSRFLSKTLRPHSGGILLVEPSASPEQRIEGKSDHYVTVGATFDQGFVWETYNDLLKAARILGADDAFLNTVRDQIGRLDPIQIGTSGQVKEYREEQAYGEIGDPRHRHVSHLCPLHPGTLISSGNPEWIEGVSTALDRRGNNTTGWAMAHRMNLRARTGEAEKAHQVYSKFLRERTLPNLWTVHPPFQIDGNLGTMAGVAEMLLQSQEGIIEPLPALPAAWNTGGFSGLVARGNFEVSVTWSDREISRFEILSLSGEPCRVRYPDAATARVEDNAGKAVSFSREGANVIHFETQPGIRYSIQLR